MVAWAAGCVSKAAVVIRAHQARVIRGAPASGAAATSNCDKDELNPTTALVLG